MTTLPLPPRFAEWRVNRIRAELQRIANACAKPRISRTEAHALAAELRNVANEVADCFICPICHHPEACVCAERFTDRSTSQTHGPMKEDLRP